MKYLNIETSAGTFSEIRKNGKYYVDKTDLLTELLKPGLSGKKLFTRPRRFGKSVTLSMIGDFLDITKDSTELFNGLKIMEEVAIVEKYMNRYPLVFLSLKDIYGNSLAKVYSKMRYQLSIVCHTYYRTICNSSDVDDVSKDKFKEIYTGGIADGDAANALGTIALCLHDCYQKKVVVLIDEYDVPLSKAYGTNHYEEVKELIESMLSSVCKENDMIQAVILTGCLHSIKGSTHTGVNNIDAFTVTMPPFSRYFGFTEDEVYKILYDAGMTEQLDIVREWYDGYLFANTHIYCPWDVLKFVVDMQRGVYQGKQQIRPKNYWVNTSGTMIEFLRGFLDKVPDAMNQFDKLLSGEAIRQPVNESLPYHELQTSGENMWSGLFEDGYLTMADNDDVLLRIPNKEIAGILMQEIGNYFRFFAESSDTGHTDLENMWDALWEGNTDKAEKLLSYTLEKAFKNLSTGVEYPYQYFLLGAAIDKGYQAEAETDAGYGRLDLKIEQPSQNRGLILETKHVKTRKDFEKKNSDSIAEAGEQIINNKYYRSLLAGKVENIRCYAVAFYKRDCRIVEIFIP